MNFSYKKTLNVLQCKQLLEIFKILLPVHMHRAKVNTFLQPFLYRRQFFQPRLLAARNLHFEPQGIALLHTLNQQN